MKRWLAALLACAMLLTLAVPALAEVSEAQEALPVEWDLDSIYGSVEEWQADYDKAMAMLDRYEEFRGKLNNAQTIYDYLQFAYYTELTETQMKLRMYAQLGSALNSTDPVFTELNARMDAMDVKESQLSAFATPEIYALPLEEREKIFADPLFEGYEYSVRAFTDPDMQPLGEEAQEALATISMGLGYGYEVFSNLEYVEMPYPIITMPDGTEAELTDELYEDIIYSRDYDDEFKAEANQLVLTRPKPYIYTLTKLLEENARQAYASALLNHYETTRESALDAYDVDPAVYDMLIEAAHEGAPDYQRYLRIHARGLGLEEQHPYDMGTYVSDFYPGKIEYEDAVAEVADALGVLGEDYVDTFMSIIKSGHVDVYPTDTKESGAFETQPSDEYLPWLLFNYNGYADDVSTIAHEGGHAVYDALATANQPRQYRSPTIFTQEVASTTNELLYYTYKMNHAADDEERLFYLENVLSMFSGTFFAQMWYAEFEDYIYQIVESGSALDPEVLGDKWMELLDTYRGDAIVAYPDARYAWSEVPHFYYVYYVYQYASAVSYAASITEGILTGEEGAVDNYLAFLKLGNSDSPQVLLATAGIDPLSEDTYRAALDYYRGLVDEYERLVDEKLAASAGAAEEGEASEVDEPGEEVELADEAEPAEEAEPVEEAEEVESAEEAEEAEPAEEAEEAEPAA